VRQGRTNDAGCQQDSKGRILIFEIINSVGRNFNQSAGFLLLLLILTLGRRV
jgi:hypothetical protein